MWFRPTPQYVRRCHLGVCVYSSPSTPSRIPARRTKFPEDTLLPRRWPRAFPTPMADRSTALRSTATDAPGNRPKARSQPDTCSRGPVKQKRLRETSSCAPCAPLSLRTAYQHQPSHHGQWPCSMRQAPHIGEKRPLNDFWRSGATGQLATPDECVGQRNARGRMPMGGIRTTFDPLVAVQTGRDLVADQPRRDSDDKSLWLRRHTACDV